MFGDGERRRRPSRGLIRGGGGGGEHRDWEAVCREGEGAKNHWSTTQQN